MIRRISMALMGAALSATSPAMASIGCQGTVTWTSTNPNGEAYAGWGSWSMRLCQLGASTTVYTGTGGAGGYTINPDTCQAILSQFMTAKAQNRTATVYTSAPTCDFTGGYATYYPAGFLFGN